MCLLTLKEIKNPDLDNLYKVMLRDKLTLKQSLNSEAFRFPFGGNLNKTYKVGQLAVSFRIAPISTTMMNQLYRPTFHCFTSYDDAYLYAKNELWYRTPVIVKVKGYLPNATGIQVTESMNGRADCICCRAIRFKEIVWRA